MLDDVLESAVANVIAANPIHEAVRSTNIINELERGDAPVPDTAEEVEGVEQIADLIVTVEEQENVQKGREVLSQEMLQRASATRLKTGGSSSST